MPYKLIRGKDTTRIYTGNYVKVQFTQKIKDSVYFTTANSLPIYMRVNETPQPYDISELWTSLHVGDSIVATQMMDTFIKRTPQNIPPEFKKGDRIMSYVKILEVFRTDSAVQKDDEKTKQQKLASEVQTIEKYLAEKNITAQKTPSGAYVQLVSPGTGPMVDSGKYVSVNYTGKSWSGKTFDSNTDTAFHHVGPYSFTVAGGTMIKGFDEAMFFMNKGAKAKVFVPSILGYGANPNSPNIKPYEHLIFDIELVNVQDKEPARPAMPPAPQKVNKP
jgi:FKBP-type peptidyl-prolyl cis-trans isomerase